MRRNPLLLSALLASVLAACLPLRAQTFDLAADRVPLTSLDGLWRFHTGDDPAWASPNFDDSQWPLLRSTEPWTTQGYKDLSGMAWYRFQIVIPAGMDHVSLFLPQIATCYELYADGILIGTRGKMPPNTMPYGGGLPFDAFALPAQRPIGGKVEIALRVWHWPGWVRYVDGGPEYGGGLVGDSDRIQELHSAARAIIFRFVAGYQTLGLLQALAGLASLALFLLRRKDREYLWFSLIMLLGAAAQWAWVSQSSQVWNVELRDLSQTLAEVGADLASILFYQALFRPRRTWLLRLALAALAFVLLDQLLASSLGNIFGVWFDVLVMALCQLMFNAWIVVVVFTAVKQKYPDARLLVAPVVLTTSVALFGNACALTNRLGWQNRFDDEFYVLRRPLPVTDHQAAAALFMLAVFAILILRFTRTSSQEERFASEVQAARGVQQFLIPEHLPATPGLAIESKYLPAKEVGGDFFQVLPQAANGGALIVVGDVAGHGMEAGMLATLIVGAVRTAAAFTTDPARILAVLNDRMQGRGLATCLALHIERDGAAALVSAGHLPPYLNGTEMAVEGALPLGALAGVDFTTVHFTLTAGDSLMLMTDGVVEAQDADGNLFGFERIAALLKTGAAPAALAAAAQAFGQQDDITVLAVARLPVAAAV